MQKHISLPPSLSHSCTQDTHACTQDARAHTCTHVHMHTSARAHTTHTQKTIILPAILCGCEARSQTSGHNTHCNYLKINCHRNHSNTREMNLLGSGRYHVVIYKQREKLLMCFNNVLDCLNKGFIINIQWQAMVSSGYTRGNTGEQGLHIKYQF